MISFLVGLVVGNFLGFILSSLMVISSETDRDDEEI